MTRRKTPYEKAVARGARSIGAANRRARMKAMPHVVVAGVTWLGDVFYWADGRWSRRLADATRFARERGDALARSIYDAQRAKGDAARFEFVNAWDYKGGDHDLVLREKRQPNGAAHYIADHWVGEHNINYDARRRDPLYATSKTKRNPIGRHKTMIATSNDESGKMVVVRYHDTNVAILNRDGSVTLNSGGWRTATTKKQINQALDEWGFRFGIAQIKGEWFVVGRFQDAGPMNIDVPRGAKAKSYSRRGGAPMSRWETPFINGMTLDHDGDVIGLRKINPASDDATRRRKFMKATGIADVANHPAKALGSGDFVIVYRNEDGSTFFEEMMGVGQAVMSDDLNDAQRFPSDAAARAFIAKYLNAIKRDGSFRVIVPTGGVKRNPSRSGVDSRVSFGKFPNGEIVAFLWDLPANPGRVVDYLHVGQHGEADLTFAKRLRAATPAQYAPLLRELTQQVGYVLDVVPHPLRTAIRRTRATKRS